MANKAGKAVGQALGKVKRIIKHATDTTKAAFS